jgi:hypothetical protein
VQSESWRRRTSVLGGPDKRVRPPTMGEIKSIKKFATAFADRLGRLLPGQAQLLSATRRWRLSLSRGGRGLSRERVGSIWGGGGAAGGVTATPQKLVRQGTPAGKGGPTMWRLTDRRPADGVISGEVAAGPATSIHPTNFSRWWLLTRTHLVIAHDGPRPSWPMDANQQRLFHDIVGLRSAVQLPPSPTTARLQTATPAIPDRLPIGGAHEADWAGRSITVAQISRMRGPAPTVI